MAVGQIPGSSTEHVTISDLRTHTSRLVPGDVAPRRPHGDSPESGHGDGDGDGKTGRDGRGRRTASPVARFVASIDHLQSAAAS